MAALASDWRDRVGSPEQLARIDRFVDADGPTVGMRRYRLETGGGLAFDVLPDRALDIGHASFDGLPLAWISPSGFAPASAGYGEGHDWLRGFGGGLLATCGLDSFGPPSEDGGRSHGQHGPVGSLAAEVTQAAVETTGRIVVAGRIRQAALFSETLVLERRIEAEIGGASISIKDRVTNAGVRSEGHMLLYHCNFGWPLLDEGAVLTSPTGQAPEPRDEPAQVGLAEWDQIGPPVADYPEQVFIHQAPSGTVRARLENACLGKAATLEWDGANLPALFQWKLMLRKHYVLGLEPANTPAIQGRAAARAAGMLPVLEPGETRSYALRISMERLP